MVGGAVTIGFGGSVGPEAPIVLTGAALGSNVGKLAKLNYRNITLLLCCGAGAAVAAIFKAPITGVVFVLEILMLDITSASVIPLIVSSVTATTIAIVLRGFDPIISVTLTENDIFQIRHIPLFILLGARCGGISYYFTTVNAKVGKLVHSIKSQYVRWGVAGVILGVLIFVFPPLYGEGYEAFREALLGEPAVSIRLNPAKWCGAVGYEPVPWATDAYYLSERPAFTFDPLLHGGCYYVQEASSQFVERLLPADVDCLHIQHIYNCTTHQKQHYGNDCRNEKARHEHPMPVVSCLEEGDHRIRNDGCREMHHDVYRKHSEHVPIPNVRLIILTDSKIHHETAYQETHNYCKL